MDWNANKPLKGIRAIMAVERQLTRELMITALKMAGAGQLSSGSAPDMLRMVKEFKPDVIFAEYSMELLTGVDFISHVRSDQGVMVPAILLVHEGDQKKATPEAKQANIEGIVIVPFSQDSLIKMTAKVLGKK